MLLDWLNTHLSVLKMSYAVIKIIRNKKLDSVLPIIVIEFVRATCIFPFHDCVYLGIGG